MKHNLKIKFNKTNLAQVIEVYLFFLSGYVFRKSIFISLIILIVAIYIAIFTGRLMFEDFERRLKR